MRISAPKTIFHFVIVTEVSCLNISKGMLHLHLCDPPIIHRDLKSPNLLVDKHWKLKVCSCPMLCHSNISTSLPAYLQHRLNDQSRDCLDMHRILIGLCWMLQAKCQCSQLRSHIAASQVCDFNLSRVMALEESVVLRVRITLFEILKSNPCIILFTRCATST